MHRISSAKSSLSKEARRAASICALAGGGFGLVASIIFLLLGMNPLHPPGLFMFALTLFTTIISGLGGLGGFYLDFFLLRRGVTVPFTRLLITFTIIVSVPAGVTLLLVFRNLDPAIQRYSLVGTFLGCIFGGLVAFINYLFWKVQQKVETLELENRYLAELAEKNRLLQEAARNLAVAEERNRMARELHDSISQGMHGIVYSLHSLRRLLGAGGREGEILNHLEQTTQATLQELRRLIMELKPSPLEDHGLEEALKLHGELFAGRQQITVEQNLTYRGGLAPEQEVALYRIAQEALANIQQHAQADRVEISLSADDGRVIMKISDNGRGFDPATVKKGNGLENMAARARQSGGVFRLHSRPGAGTVLEVSFTTSR